MEPVDLFYSYAHEDEGLRDELAGHLKIMERRNVIRSWHDRRIVPGQQWDKEIDTQLEAADLVLLLISADFISSDYIWGHELEVALNRHRDGKASVVPVMLRSVDITDAPFAALQGLPTDLRPVTSWPNRDEAWTDVAKGIRRAVEQIQIKWSRMTPTPPQTLSPPEALPKNSDILSKILHWSLPAPAGIPGDSSIVTETASQRITEALTTDPLLNRIVKEFSAKVTEAAKARGVSSVDSAQAEQYARTLIDAPNQKRILWVDDRPDNNRLETAALAKLQIEVVAVTSTKAALDRLASDSEPFDLVLSDWQRPELHIDLLSAGIHLLRELRARHQTMPVIFYHGSVGQERIARREVAIREGAFGEAVMPDELLGLVTSALG